MTSLEVILAVLAVVAAIVALSMYLARKATAPHSETPNPLEVITEPAPNIRPDGGVEAPMQEDGSLGTIGTVDSRPVGNPQLLLPGDKPYVVYDLEGDHRKKALLVGINTYSPYVYQGDSMPLRGCVNDAVSLRNFLNRQGYGKIIMLTDKAATIGNFLLAWKDLIQDVGDGDTIFLSMSRHGASLGENVMDREGDVEVSGRNRDGYFYSGDQAAVMYAGMIPDDCFWMLFSNLPKVKLIFWNDSCHSATQYRTALLPGGRNRLDIIPRVADRAYLPGRNRMLDVRQLEAEFPKIDKSPEFTLVSLAACQDTEYAADARMGNKFQGAFTALGLSLIGKNLRISPEDFSKKIGPIMRANGFPQKPQVNVVGDPAQLTKPIF